MSIACYRRLLIRGSWIGGRRWRSGDEMVDRSLLVRADGEADLASPMSLSEYPPSMRSRIHIDTAFLLHHLSALAQVKRKRRTWNELGEKLLRDFMETSPAARMVRSRDEPAISSVAGSWSMAKGRVHAVVASQDPQHHAIRRRLGNLQNPSTPVLLSALGLWLAGVLGISTSVTGPLVAVMLYGVAEAEGDWDVLGSPHNS